MKMTKMRHLDIKAMSLNIPTGPHPNKMPFNGVLVHLDKLSDSAPGGANGKRIIVTSAAGRKALPSLLGMAVDFTPSLDGHDAKNKIGVITSADIVGNAIVIAGFVYAADFPETAGTIKALKSVLGFSFEAQRLTVLDPCADVLTITALTFTGAAILLKAGAAYTTTSIAASAADKGMIKMSYVQQTEKPTEAPKKPFPYSFTQPQALARTLSVLGFELPGTITALAASNQPLGKSGLKISVAELDMALKGYDIPIQKRMQLKGELVRQGLL
jgi:hypothetical protein